MKVPDEHTYELPLEFSAYHLEILASATKAGLILYEVVYGGRCHEDNEAAFHKMNDMLKGEVGTWTLTELEMNLISGSIHAYIDLTKYLTGEPPMKEELLDIIEAATFMVELQDEAKARYEADEAEASAMVEDPITENEIQSSMNGFNMAWEEFNG